MSAASDEQRATADRASPSTPGRPGRAGFWTALAAAIIGLGIAVGLIALLVGPALGSALAAERASGSQAYGIAADMSPEGAPAAVRPGEGWTVQPAVAGGLQLHAPDGLLEVVLTAGSAADLERSLAELNGTEMRERLASGLELRHLTEGDRFTAVVSAADGDAVLVRATIHSPAAFADYRAALSGLLESIEIR